MKRFISGNLNFFRRQILAARLRASVMDFIADRDVDVILDVGANVGQFGGLMRANGYRGKIISFEPVSASYQTLAARAAADSDWETNNFAFGAAAGCTTINVTAASVYSSMLPSRDAAMAFDRQATVTHVETIEVRKLDDLLPALSGNILLKIDTQGFERQVLEGGRQVLHTLKGVLMELPIIHLYEGVWHFHEAIAFMQEAGFVAAQIHPVNYHPADRVSLVEVDCLFRPHDSRLD